MAHDSLGRLERKEGTLSNVEPLNIMFYLESGFKEGCTMLRGI